jgi:sialate O-acetylesterase
MQRFCIVLVVVFSIASGARAEVKPNALFSDGAVLQQGMPVPVWGTAAPDEKITVEFAGQKKTAAADAQGRWKVTLDPMPASAESRSLKISSSLNPEPLTLSNVLVGEVWICSGQSNMAMGGKADATEAGVKVRMFAVGSKSAVNLKPQSELTGTWGECPPGSRVPSSVGYFFARDLAKARGVPVGMIRSAIGGTGAQVWISLSGMEKDSELKHYAEKTRKVLENCTEAKVIKFEQDLADFRVKSQEWKDKKLSVPKPVAPGSPERGVACSTGFNALIAPLMPYAIKGVIWYQGESNGWDFKQSFEYRTLFARLIADWREKWGQGDFPFLFVQLPPFNGFDPEIREAQLLTLKKTPNTAMAVTMDVGDAKNIHPPQKEPVGARLALAARALAYGEKIEYSGPEYDSFKIDKNRVILSFKHVGGGLLAKDSPLKGFTISGADEKNVDAKAEIVGDTIVVSSDQVPAPVAVRYSWAPVPDGNLWNKDGLPASPFRTDPDMMLPELPKAGFARNPI